VRIVGEALSMAELTGMAEELFGNFVKAVVDVQLKVMVVGGELHADEEALLLQEGSRQEDLWGINIYPELPREQWIEFDSMINVRPAQGNRGRAVEDEQLRSRIVDIVNALVKD
jgi:hypothetical protein